MNTATYRGMARKAEAAQNCEAAAKFYDKAADLYPTKPSPGWLGTLAARDVAALRQNAANCRAMVQS
jgi:hypothetical protein